MDSISSKLFEQRSRKVSARGMRSKGDRDLLDEAIIEKDGPDSQV